jgi:hypothetical protein
MHEGSGAREIHSPMKTITPGSWFIAQASDQGQPRARTALYVAAVPQFSTERYRRLDVMEIEMKPTIPAEGWHENIDHHEPVIHDWRARQLARLGIPLALAEAVADYVDWHRIAAGLPRLPAPAGPPDRLVSEPCAVAISESSAVAIGKSPALAISQSPAVASPACRAGPRAAER